MKNIDINKVYNPNAPICPPWKRFGVVKTMEFKIDSLPGFFTIQKRIKRHHCFDICIDDEYLVLTQK